jgi:hypothetical protein
VKVAALQLDKKNPRLGRETLSHAPREVIQYLFDHDKAIELASSIATRGYFPNEPLLAIREGEHFTVVEGNRRLAALKALREPGLLEGPHQKKVEKLARRIHDIDSIASVPVTIAPDRRSTDKQIAGRHVGTPVLPWQAENRASFIIEKLAEGYSNDELRDELGFSLADIQKARQTRAIADMARSLDLPDEVKAKLDNPRTKLFTTIERVIESSSGRAFFHIEPDPEHGIRGKTTKNEFAKGFGKLVHDIVTGKQSSRTLNTNEDIRKYLASWSEEEVPSKKRGSFVPSDLIKGPSVASPASPKEAPKPATKGKAASKCVLPRDFKVRHGSERLIDIREELVRLRREEFPNAGAVLLRVFFELSVLDYLERIGELDAIKQKLVKKNGRLQFDTPTMKQLAPEIVRIAKSKLTLRESNTIAKAIKYDPSSPFTLSDMHSFVHSEIDLPSPRDILQFWMRTESLFRLMLEKD